MIDVIFVKRVVLIFSLITYWLSMYSNNDLGAFFSTTFIYMVNSILPLHEKYFYMDQNIKKISKAIIYMESLLLILLLVYISFVSKVSFLFNYETIIVSGFKWICVIISAISFVLVFIVFGYSKEKNDDLIAEIAKRKVRENNQAYIQEYQQRKDYYKQKQIDFIVKKSRKRGDKR
ncbi:hypothetical protein M0R79_01645 [Ignavigranum ruoffiae]|uniref:hypothetical protein n=1 Tax=Ignavigranum ruoffiae TaxID=89093 RepID=UPI002051D7B2|nr:hypothetical protein [Ignavigranum ruoffiae]UPQ86107.1 hypothetical protein M0R79_01645 [Ignavigranum ruoffiae]